MLIIFILPGLNSQDNIEIIKKISAHRIYEGYNVLSTDSIIRYKDKRYLVDVIEDYDESKLFKVSIWKPMGYLEFSNKDLIRSKKFQKAYELSDTVFFEEQKGGRMLINGRTFYIEKRFKTRMYITNPSHKDKLYVIDYR